MNVITIIISIISLISSIVSLVLSAVKYRRIEKKAFTLEKQIKLKDLSPSFRVISCAVNQSGTTATQLTKDEADYYDRYKSQQIGIGSFRRKMQIIWNRLSENDFEETSKQKYVYHQLNTLTIKNLKDQTWTLYMEQMREFAITTTDTPVYYNAFSTSSPVTFGPNSEQTLDLTLISSNPLGHNCSYENLPDIYYGKNILNQVIPDEFISWHKLEIDVRAEDTLGNQFFGTFTVTYTNRIFQVHFQCRN